MSISRRNWKNMLGFSLALPLVIYTSTGMALAQTAPGYMQTTTTTYGQPAPQRCDRCAWSNASPAAKIFTGTAVGAAAGGATGALTGLTMHATSHHAMKMAKGTAVARGLGWGSVYGAGIGFLVGLTSAIVSPRPVATSSVGHTTY
jgi:hypothetical protein